MERVTGSDSLTRPVAGSILAPHERFLDTLYSPDSPGKCRHAVSASVGVPVAGREPAAGIGRAARGDVDRRSAPPR